MLDADYITACERRARRFQATWDQGTSGTLAAAVMRLLMERKELMATLDEANKAIRDAVTDRMAGTPADDPKMVGWQPPESCCEGGKCQPKDDALATAVDAIGERVRQAQERCDAAIPVDWILQGERELKEQRLRGDGVLNSPSDNYAEWEPEAFQPRTQAHETLNHAIAAVLDRHQKYGPPMEHFGRTAALVNAAFGTAFTAADWALVMVLDKVARQRGPAATDDAAIDIAGYAACHQECRRASP